MSFDLKIEKGDIKIGSNGDLQKVENSEKLIQDILKIAITPSGGNPFFPMYGSSISRSLIGMPYNSTMVGSLATDQLRTSLENLQKFQKIQQQQGQRVTASELLAAIQQIRIERNQTDPRYFRIFINGLARDFTSFKTQFDIGL